MAAKNPVATAIDKNASPDTAQGSIWANERDTGTVPAQPSAPEFVQQANRIEETTQRYGRSPTGVVPDRSESIFASWPTKLYTTHPDDQTYNLQRSIVDPNGVVPHLGQAIVDKSYFEYQNEKAKQIELAKFKVWLLSQMDLSTPEKRAFWETKHPEIFEDRRKNMEQQFDIAKKMALINIFGPKEMDDWLFQYLVEQGKIEIPSGSLYDPKAHPTTTFNRGFFNVKRIKPSDQLFGQSATTPFQAQGPFNRNTNASKGLFGDASGTFGNVYSGTTIVNQ